MNIVPPILSKTTWLAALLSLSAAMFAASLQAQTPRFADATQDVSQVLALIERRLSLMPEIAAWKWHAQQPIADLERERQVLERSVAEAQAIGLDAASARRFFDVQIRMARAVQAQHFERWRGQAAAQVPSGRDLNTELRPALDATSRELLVAVYVASAALPQVLQEPRILVQLDRLHQYGGVDEAQVAELRAALAAMRIDTEASLARIKRVGVIRVGTTGDYAPFSSDRDGVLTGFDVSLAIDLAHHLGVKISFVRTTWPTLMDDFHHHRFDIAMSGISVTPERAVHADFSTAYHVDGKTPIARCKVAAQFATLDQIDKPEVRVIVNPGGTNERFVRERIKRATIVVHADNRTVFDEVVAGRADVMFTDGIEVALQVQRYPTQLCGTMRAPLTQAQKAIMLPREGWKNAVDNWLAPQLKSGQVQERLQLALLAAQ